MNNIEHNLESLEKLLDEQIGKVTKKDDISPNELENMTKTLCLLEKIKDYKEDVVFEDEEDEGYSQARGRYARRMYDNPRGMSHRGSRYSRRSPYYEDSDPYYYRDGHSYGRRGGEVYRRDYGYSGHSIKDRMIAKLESMYDEAKTDHEKQIVDEWINRLSTD